MLLQKSLDLTPFHKGVIAQNSPSREPEVDPTILLGTTIAEKKTIENGCSELMKNKSAFFFDRSSKRIDRNERLKKKK